MKVFVADCKDKGYTNKNDYHWTHNNEILMFGVFQTDNPRHVSMCGIDSRCFTTHILVKELNIDKDFYGDLIIDSIEKSMNCKVNQNGDFMVDVGFTMNFNIHQIINELIDKANQFSDNEKVRCLGRNIYKI